MLNHTSSYSATPAVIRRAIRFSLAVLIRLVHGWVAAAIARRERQANLVMLQSLGDRELRDIGLSRSQIGEGLADAAATRSRLQRFDRS
jgi:uncharacterized protein YjiS (DUF1127 family)